MASKDATENLLPRSVAACAFFASPLRVLPWEGRSETAAHVPEPRRTALHSFRPLLVWAVVVAVAAACPFAFAQDDDHGDTTDTATAVEVGSSTSGTLTAGDDDYFSVELAADGTLTFYTEGETDTRGTLTSDDGAVSQEDDDLGDGLNFHIERELAAGTYFVRVRGYDDAITGDYTFHVSADPVTADDHGDKLQTATAVALPSSETAGALTGGDHDYFRITLAQANNLTVQAEGDIDTYGTLMNEDGSVVGNNDDSGDGANFRIVADLEAGTYFVRVRGYSSSTSGNYTFKASTPSTATAPIAAPDNVQVVAGPGTLTVSWEAVDEANDGGSPITGYTATATPVDDGANAECTAAATETTCTIEGLAAGATFNVTVRADNAAGAGPASDPAIQATTPTAPTAAPENVAVTAGLRHLAVTWDAVPEADDGGSPITGYAATATPEDGEDATCTTDAEGLACSIGGLTAGTAYSVTAQAANAVGNGPSSTAVASTTLPPTRPTAAPGNIQVTPGVGRLTVTWDALPVADDGGSPITSYGASTGTADGESIGACTADAETFVCTISGLTPGFVHAVTVHATNALGDGVASDPVYATPISRSYRFIGEQAEDGAGWSLASVTLPSGASDLLIGAPFYTVRNADGDRATAGAGYLIAAADMVGADAADGREDGTILLGNAAAQPNSWKFVGEAAGDSAGWGIAPVAGLDADDATDVAIGAPLRSEGGNDAGAVYLVASADFAAADAADGTRDGVIDLGEAAGLAASWKILGAPGHQLGTAVVDAGDVGGDGTGELLLHTQPGADPNRNADVGAAFLFSLADLADADAADGTEDGVIQTQHAAAQTGSWEFTGTSLGGAAGRGIAAVGDIDGDDLADILLGAPHQAPAGRGASGAAYLAAGADLAAADTDDDGVIDVADLAAHPASWQLAGERAFDLAGESVASAGDIDGDGMPDLIVGAPKHAHRGQLAGGAAYLVAAASLDDADAADANTDGAISLANIAAQTDSWKFVGDAPSDEAGVMLSSAGDADGDGLADLLIGTDADATYLIATQDLPAADAADGTTDGVIDIGSIAAQPNSWKLAGTGQLFGNGLSLISVGDVDGDGVPDVMIGTAQSTAGAVFLVTAETLGRLDAADSSADGVVGFDAIVNPPEDDVYETAELAVEVLGDGSIHTSSGTRFQCSSSGHCKTLLRLGTSLTIHALPNAGYEFRQWAGCDTTSDHQCNVTAGRDRIVRAYFVSTEPITLHDQVVEFDAARAQTIRDFDPATGLIQFVAGADLADIDVGTVIVSEVLDEDKGFPHGFALHVEEVITIGSIRHLRTTPADLRDIIKSGTLIAQTALSDEDVSAYVLPPGIVPSSTFSTDTRFLPPVQLPDGKFRYELKSHDLQAAQTDASDEPQTKSFTPCKTFPIGNILSNDDGSLKIHGGGSISVCGALTLYIDGDQRDISGDLRVALDARFGIESSQPKPLEFTVTIIPLSKSKKIVAGPAVIFTAVNLRFYAKVVPISGPDYEYGLRVSISQGLGGSASFGAGDTVDVSPRDSHDDRVMSGTFDGTAPKNFWTNSFKIAKVQSATFPAGARVSGQVSAEFGAFIYGINGAFIGIGPAWDGAVATCENDPSDIIYHIAIYGKIAFGLAWGIPATVESKLDEWSEIEIVGSVLDRVPGLNWLRDKADDIYFIDWFDYHLANFSSASCAEMQKLNVPTLDMPYVEYGGGRPLLVGRWTDEADLYAVEIAIAEHWSAVQIRNGLVNWEYEKLYVLDDNPESPDDIETRWRFEPDTLHKYRVKALRSFAGSDFDSDWSAWSSPIVTPIDREEPSTPDGLNAIRLGNRSIDWSWERSEDNWEVLGYELELVRSDGYSSVERTRLNRFTTGGPGNIEHCVTVTAYDAAGNHSLPITKCERTLAEAAWRFRARCNGQDEYAIESRFDAGGGEVATAKVGGRFSDYDEKELRYRFRLECRPQDDPDGVCHTWHDAGERIEGFLEMYQADDVVRRDEFSGVNLASGVDGANFGFDTGDIRTTTTVSDGGCDAFVRFDQGPSGVSVESQARERSVRASARTGMLDRLPVFVP